MHWIIYLRPCIAYKNSSKWLETKLEQHWDFQKQQRLWRVFIWCLMVQRREAKVIISFFFKKPLCEPQEQGAGFSMWSGFTARQ